jgi:hypothetical protein
VREKVLTYTLCVMLQSVETVLGDSGTPFISDEFNDHDNGANDEQCQQKQSYNP